MNHKKHEPRKRLIIGWREFIGLPELGIDRLEAKIDTGARTSALHAENIEHVEHEGTRLVRFEVPQEGREAPRICTAPFVEQRMVKNTSGLPEERVVVETLLALAHRRWHIEVSLADRANMALPLILGRTALRRHKVLVDPGRSHLTTRAAHRKDRPE